MLYRVVYVRRKKSRCVPELHGLARPLVLLAGGEERGHARATTLGVCRVSTWLVPFAVELRKLEPAEDNVKAENRAAVHRFHLFLSFFLSRALFRLYVRLRR